MKNAFFHKRDILIVLALAAAALWAYFLISGEKGGEAVIIYDSETVKTVNLSDEGVFSVEEAPHVVFRIKNGGISFIESDCPDKVCIRAGVLTKSGESAACLPNRIIVRVAGSANEIDALAR